MPPEEVRPIDCEGKIDPSLFPVPETETPMLEWHASRLRTAGQKMEETGGDIVQAWEGLTSCYSAPEAQTLHEALDPVAPQGVEVNTATERAAGALEDFAETVREIQGKWRTLTVDSYSFRAEIAEEGEDWNKGDGLFGTRDSANDIKNEALLLRAANLVGDFEQAEITCANTINVGLAGRTDFVSEKDLDGAAPDPDQFVHGYGADLTELPTSWGEAAAGTDYGWVRDVGSAVWDFGVGAVEGVGAAVGAHSSEGWFAQSWGDSLKEYHWGNLTSAASLVGMYDAESDSLGWAGLSSAGQAWKDLAHSVVPWEEWGERPGYVIGTALLNIGATVGGAVLTATGVGAVVGVPLMAWRGAAILDGMGSSNRGGGDGGVDLPNLPEVPTYGGNGAPVVNIDTSNMTPTQVAQVTASLDRLNTTSSSGSGSSGESGSGGRPVNARQHTEPTGGDLNRADRVSQNTSTRESGSGNGSRKNDTEKPPNWTSDSGDSVDIKPNRSGSEPEPALVSSRNDGDVLTESKKTPTPVPVRANATDIDTPGSGSRSGNEIADNTRGDRSADVQDNKNSVQNQSEEGPSPSKGGSEDSNDSRFQRDGDGDSATDRNSDQRDHDRNEGDRNESTGHNDDQERVTYTTKPEEGAWSKDLKESYSLDDERVRRLPEPTTIPPGDPRQIPTNLSRGGILERISEDNGYKIERRNGLIETVNGKPLEDFVHQRTLEREKEIKLFTDGEVADNDKRQDRNKKKRSELLIERSNLKDGSKAPGDGTVSVQISRADLGGAKGGVYSLVMDRRTGLLAEGMNGKDKTVRLDPENDLHPHLQDRLEKMTREGGQDSDGNPTDMPHWDDPLRHAEVKALNELLLARKDAKMSDFMLENRFFLKDGPKPDKSTIENESIDEKRTREENIERKKNSPCCANCSRMTDGATSPKSGKLWFMPGDPRNNT